jgi:hypothetical protein
MSNIAHSMVRPVAALATLSLLFVACAPKPPTSIKQAEVPDSAIEPSLEPAGTELQAEEQQDAAAAKATKEEEKAAKEGKLNPEP